jgi:uncharacterized protein YjbI with pentapeptide repeats
MSANLKRRWQSEHAQGFLEKLARWGRSGNGYEILESPFGIITETGLLDVRGLVLPERSDLRRITFKSADLTGSVLRRIWFEGSIFVDVVFDDASLRTISEARDTFERCRFLRTSFRDAVIGHHGSRFKDCHFEKADFMQASFIRAEFNECCFDNCTFSGVNFQASSFERCEFRGEVRGVWFHGEYQISSILEQFANPRPNRMTSVSFKNATLFDVNFSDGCDLSSVLPPEDGRHALFDRWQERVKLLFEQSRAWPEPCRRQAEIFYESVRSKPNADGTLPKPQEWYLIALDDLANQHGRESGMRIWEALLATREAIGER